MWDYDGAVEPNGPTAGQPTAEGKYMHCPFCRHEDSRVVDSRSLDDGSAIRRRRQCQSCGKRFTTMETTALTVVKRSGVAEPFDRSKVINGVRKACQGRPVTNDDLAMLAQEVEETIRATGNAEVDAHEVGLAILEVLQQLPIVFTALGKPEARINDQLVPLGISAHHQGNLQSTKGIPLSIFSSRLRQR